jgi:hypothetical protein
MCELLLGVPVRRHTRHKESYLCILMSYASHRLTGSFFYYTGWTENLYELLRFRHTSDIFFSLSLGAIAP